MGEIVKSKPMERPMLDSNYESVQESSENYFMDRLSLKFNKELAIVNGKINEMNRDTLVKNLKTVNLETYGAVPALKRRLRTYYRKNNLPSSNLNVSSQLYPYYIVVDFEATCNEVNPPDYQHEIIEFPAVLVDSEKRTVVDEFHEYVKPKLNSKLTAFCSELTGISQETVDNANDFPVVLNNFELWLKKHNLGSRKRKYGIVTDGPWDMGKFMFLQCQVSDLEFPSYAEKWVNIRKTYSNFYRATKTRLPYMLEELGIELQGRLHSGLDDSRNIAALLLVMIGDGASVKVNESLKEYLARKNYARHNNEILT